MFVCVFIQRESAEMRYDMDAASKQSSQRQVNDLIFAIRVSKAVCWTSFSRSLLSGETNHLTTEETIWLKYVLKKRRPFWFAAG